MNSDATLLMQCCFVFAWQWSREGANAKAWKVEGICPVAMVNSPTVKAAVRSVINRRTLWLCSWAIAVNITHSLAHHYSSNPGFTFSVVLPSKYAQNEQKGRKKVRKWLVFLFSRNSSFPLIHPVILLILSEFFCTKINNWCHNILLDFSVKWKAVRILRHFRFVEICFFDLTVHDLCPHFWLHIVLIILFLSCTVLQT